MNAVLPWSLNLIERFEGRWDWGWFSEDNCDGMEWDNWEGISLNQAISLPLLRPAEIVEIMRDHSTD